MTDALATIRVVDLSLGIAGPYCTKLFVDAGADVVKVEPPGGDPLRWYTAAGLDLGESATGDGAGVLFRYLNAGKRSIVGEPGDADVRELVAGADLVVDSGRLSTSEITALRAEHPQVVVLTVTPFGRTGPLAGPRRDRLHRAGGVRHARVPRPPRVPAGADGRTGMRVPRRGLRRRAGARRGAARPPHRGRRGHRRVDDRGHGDRGFDVRRHGESPRWASGDHDARPQLRDAVDRAGERRAGRIQHEHPADVPGVLHRSSSVRSCGDTEWANLGVRIVRIDEWQKIIDEQLPNHPVAEIVEQAAALRVPVTPVHNAATLPTNEHVVARGDAPRATTTVCSGPVRPTGSTTIPCPRHGARRGSASTRATSSRASVPCPTDPGADACGPPARRGQGAGPHVVVGGHVGHPRAGAAGRRGHPRRIDHAPRRDATHRRHVRCRALVGVRAHVRGGEHRQARHHARRSAPSAVASCCVRLVGWADVLVENFAPRVVENWGLDRRRRCLAINPGIVYMRHAGVRARRAVARARCVRADTGAGDGAGVDHRLSRRPAAHPARHRRSQRRDARRRSPCSSRWRERDRTGTGVFVEAPMVEAALNIAAQPVMEHSAYGYLMERMGNRSPRIAPQGLYACRGFEQWLALSVATDDQWRGAPRRARRSQVGTATHALDTLDGRLEHHDELDAELREWAIEQDLDDAVVLARSPRRPRRARLRPAHPVATPAPRGARAVRGGRPPRARAPSRRRGCRTGSPASTAGCTAPRRRSARTTTTCSRASSASPTTRSPSSRPTRIIGDRPTRPLTPPRPRIGVEVRQ